MARYHAYQIITNDAYEMGADTHTGDLWSRFVDSLRAVKADRARIEEIEIGQVEAENIDDALNEIRADKWINKTYVRVKGASPAKV